MTRTLFRPWFGPPFGRCRLCGAPVKRPGARRCAQRAGGHRGEQPKPMSGSQQARETGRRGGCRRADPCLLVESLASRRLPRESSLDIHSGTPPGAST